MNTDLAALLSKNTHRIAQLELAGECYREIFDLAGQIEHVINRPVPPIEVGPCPTIDPETQKPCAVGLTAKRGDVETTCYRCKITYNVKELIDHALDNARHWLYSERELLSIMADIGEHIPRGTWWSWRQRGVIESRNEWGAEPKYWLEDARKLYAERVGTRRTA